MVTFNPPVVPSQGSRVNKEALVTEVNVGDGYVHRCPNGINGVKRKTSLRWEKISAANSATIDAFFASMGGYIPFSYTLPGENTAYAYVCKQWSADSSDAGMWTVTAELEQTFDNT